MESSYPLDGDLDEISGLHRRDACRGSGGDQVSGHQRHGCADIAQEMGDRKDQVDGIALLPHHSIQPGFDAQTRLGFDLVGDDRADRAKGVKALGRDHCPSDFCRSRAVTSFTMV